MKKLKPLPAPTDRVVGCPGCPECEDGEIRHRWIERRTAKGWTVVYDSIDGPRVPVSSLPAPLRRVLDEG